MSGIFSITGNSAPTGFYDYSIDQSLRFEDGDSAYLARTPSSASNRTTWTWSAWIKRGNLSYSSANMFSAYSGANDFEYIRFDSDDCIRYTYYISGSVQNLLKTSGSFRDTSAWYHILVQRSGSSSEIYVNGVQQDLQTETRASTNGYFNHTVAHNIGRFGGTGQHFDGYMAEMHFVDGTSLNPTSFGETKAGIWVPKNYTGSHGTNGFYLPFDDSSAIGDDESANTNDFTATNLAATDVVLDSPTNNWCTINSEGSIGTQSEGNLKQVTASTGSGIAVGSIGQTSGKWYWEVNVNNSSSADLIGVVDETLDSVNSGSYVGYLTSAGEDSIAYYSNGSSYINGTPNSSYGATYTTGDIIGVALNLDDNEITFYKNNSSQGAISYTFSGGNILPAVCDGTSSASLSTFILNFGQDSSFAGTETAQGNTDANGKGDFYYSPPSGFLALCSANLPDPAIDPAQDEESADYFEATLWTGNGSTQSISSLSFQPDWVWIKERSGGASHAIFDSVRGATERLKSDATDAELTQSTGLTSFDSNGFSLGSNTAVNASSDTFVGWSWLAGGTASSNTDSNTDGSITSSVSANTKAGFSIVSFTGNGSAGSTVGHGLSAIPEMIILKERNVSGDSWVVYHNNLGDAGYLVLNSTGAEGTSATLWGDGTSGVRPTSSVFTIGANSSINQSGSTFIAYCFHSVSGYSAAGLYTGNGSSDGSFIYTGHRVAWLMVKRTDSTGNWYIMDNKRNTFNAVNNHLYPNLSSAESASSHDTDFLSNGFKARGSAADLNASGGSYIYLAFAEQPFKYANAR